VGPLLIVIRISVFVSSLFRFAVFRMILDIMPFPITCFPVPFRPESCSKDCAGVDVIGGGFQPFCQRQGLQVRSFLI
jgi:hypothetical protein